MHGVLNFLKPPGMTSHDAVAFVRRVLKTKRVGHTGTLDPAAAGVLPICVGQATRLVENLQNGRKEYLAEATFGFETDTLDQCGEVVKTCDASQLDLETLRRALDNFRGEITQTPPMFSAIKVDGQKLYDLAREGKTVEIPTRQVQIHRLFCTHFQSGDQPKAFLQIECGGGTYIRSLVRDIGQNLGLCATMTHLNRTRSGAFLLENAVTPQEFEAKPELIALETVLGWCAHWKWEDDEATLRLWQGKLIAAPELELREAKKVEKDWHEFMRRFKTSFLSGAPHETALFHNAQKTLFALAIPSDVSGFYKAEKVFDLRTN